jgi:DNA repair protein SbcD/Mre11
MSQRQFRFLHAANLRLDQPPHGMAEAPEHLVDTLIDCPLQAATRLFDSAIDLRVCFVLLSGNTINAERAAPRELDFLMEQFNRLAAQNIAVFWAADDFAPSMLWPTCVSWPANVRIFPSNSIASHIHAVAGRSICEIVAFCGKAAFVSPLVEVRGDGAGIFRVGIAPREWTNVPTQLPGFKYWALCNSVERQSPQNAQFQAHCPGTHQGRSPVEDGPHGATLVTVDEEQRVKLRPVDSDAVRFTTFSIDVSPTATAAELEGLLLDRAEKLRDENSDRSVLVQWKISCEPKLRAALRQGTLASDLASKLNAAFGQAAPYVWTCGVQAEMPAEPPLEWRNEQTLRGDFLRAISRVSNIDQPGDLSSTLFGLPSGLQERLLSGACRGTAEQQQVMHEAAWLGAELLSPAEARP